MANHGFPGDPPCPCHESVTGTTRGGLPLVLLRTEVEDGAFAAHHDGRDEERPREVRRSTSSSVSEVSEADGWLVRRRGSACGGGRTAPRVSLFSFG
ncbi:hypothetical protein V6Z11_A10G001300 [Gossypium hirsutum]